MTTSTPPSDPPQRPLTLRQKRFVKELPLARTQTEAAIRAGYSPHVAASMASENLKKPQVQAALQQQGNLGLDQASAQRQAAEAGLVAQIGERKRVLSEIIRTRQPGPYPVSAVIQASDQLNRMEGVYVDRSISLHGQVSRVDLVALALAQRESQRAALESPSENDVPTRDDGQGVADLT